MTKNEFLTYSFEEVLKMANSKNYLKQKIDNLTILSIAIKSYSEDRIIKLINTNPEIINEKNEDGMSYMQMLSNMGKVSILEHYASHINLSQKTYDGDSNMLVFFTKKGFHSLVFKALSCNPSSLNEKDPTGCVGIERLADANCSTTLEHFAEHIDLLKRDYSGENNMLGYLTKKGFSNVISKALNHNPLALNEKDPSGCVGTERLVDSGHIIILEEFAHNIDLLKRDYAGEKNMLGYIAKKGMFNVLDKALEKNPNALNEKDSSGCVGTEHLVDMGCTNILLKYAENIDLLKRDYTGDKNMLGYLCKKGMLVVIQKSLQYNIKSLNEKDSSGCLGVERLADIDAISLINDFASEIDWSRNATNDLSIFKYVIKKSKNLEIAQEITIKAIIKNPMILNKEIKFIIDSGLSNIFSFKEILNKVDKSMSVGDMNLLAYLSSKKQEKYVDLILNPEKTDQYFIKEKIVEDYKIEISESENFLNDFKINKEIPENPLEEKRTKKVSDIKSKFKSML